MATRDSDYATFYLLGFMEYMNSVVPRWHYYWSKIYILRLA